MGTLRPHPTASLRGWRKVVGGRGPFPAWVPGPLSPSRGWGSCMSCSVQELCESLARSLGRLFVMEGSPQQKDLSVHYTRAPDPASRQEPTKATDPREGGPREASSPRVVCACRCDVSAHTLTLPALRPTAPAEPWGPVGSQAPHLVTESGTRHSWLPLLSIPVTPSRVGVLCPSLSLSQTWALFF